MIKQTFDVVINEEKIDISKNDIVIYSISIKEKTINLMNLYEKMDIKIDDEILFKRKLEPIDEPKNDSERIYNNTINFINSLLYNINEKLKEIRSRESESTF